jgi:hypothetical protein
MTSDPKAPGAAAVYLYREETEDDPHHFRTVYARIKVLTEKGKELATVQISYARNFVFYATGNNRQGNNQDRSGNDPNHSGQDQPWDVDSYAGHIEVSAIEGRTIHPDGTIVPLTGTPADLLKTRKGRNQINEMTFNLPSVEVGSILEYRYQVRYDRFQSAPKWQIQQPFFVHKAHYRFTPADQFLPDRTIGGTGVSSSVLKGAHDEVLTDVRATSILPAGKVLKQNAQSWYVLDLTDIPPIPDEPFAPPLDGLIYQADFYYAYTPDEREYWRKEMQFWNKGLSPYVASSAAIQRAVADTTSSSDSAPVKAKKLYDYVQKLDNTDFHGGAGFSLSDDSVPSGNAGAVLENKRGNSEQIAFAYLALARAAGLSAKPVRIASRNFHIFNPQFMNTSQLDSVVISVTVDGQEIFLDPGQKMAPFRTLHWSHAGAGGVTLAGDGKVETVITPLSLYTDNNVVRVGKLSVNAQGEVTGTLKVGFTGQEALYWRQLALRTDAETLKQTLDRSLAAQVPNGIEAHVDHITGLDDLNAQLVAVVQVKGALASHTGSRIVLPRLFFESKESDPFPAAEQRLLPVYMNYPAQEQEQITYLIPAGFALDGTPEDKKFNWENNASYQLRSKVDATSITTARVLARGFTMLEASNYNDLRDFYQKAVTADQQQIVLSAVSAASH